MPGGVISTGTHPKALWPGVHAWWGQNYAQHQTEYTDLYEVQDSSGAYEEDVQLTSFGLAPAKPEGAPMAYDSEGQGFISRYNHIAYALGYKVTYEERRDNKYEVVSNRRAAMNAFSINQTIENTAAIPYNDAFTGAFYTHADGLSLVNTAHINATGGTFSNQGASADLQEAALEDASIAIMGFQNDRGMMVSVMPNSLIIPRQKFFQANRIMKSVMQPDTNNNNINVLKATNAFPGGIKLNHYLTAPNSWFIRTNVPNGMNFFWRDRPDFAQDNDFDTKNAKAATYMRFSMGDTDPRGIYAVQGP